MSLILSGTDGLSDVDGSAATPAIRGTDANTGIFFPAADTIAFSEGGAEAMRIDGSGNLGIGTTSPTQKLDVNGSVKSSGFYIGTTGTSGFAALGTTGNATDGGNFVGRSATSTFNAGGVEVYAGGAERMRIDSSGNLLVGTTTSVGRLTMKQSDDNSHAGGINFVRAANSNYAGFVVASDDNLYLGFNAASKGVFNNGTGAYTTISDRALKENISEIPYGIDSVMSLNPVQYNMIGGAENQLGFIAQEAKEVIPESVSEMVGGYLGMDKSSIIPVLVKAIQELKATVDAQAARIAALESAGA
jgi:hypothetical protein